jgi:hypothetical protein
MNAVLGNEALVFPYVDGGGYDSVAAGRVRNFWNVINGYTVKAALNEQLREAVLGLKAGFSGSFSTTFSPLTKRLNLLARTGVTTIIASPEAARELTALAKTTNPVQLTPVYSGSDASVFNLVGNQPVGWVVHEADVVSSPARALARFTDPGFDYRNRMVVEPDQNVGASGQISRRGSGRGVAASRDPIALNHSSFTVDTETAGWLVTADMYAPGWHATVNGHSTTLLRADYTLRAVAVPAGRSRVVLTYRPPGFAFGLATSGIVAIGLLCIAALALQARRRRTAHQGLRRPSSGP